MRSAYLEDARPQAVSHAVRDVLEARGALVNEHVSSRVRFQHRPDESGWTWMRSGYVGIYQPYGEKDVEVRLILRARWPHRIFWLVALIDVIVALLTFVINPPGTTWFVLAFVAGLALLLAALMYVNTWRNVRDEEGRLMDAFEESFRRENVAATLEDEEERELRKLEAELEGEVARREYERERKAQPKAPRERRTLPKPKFKLTLGGKKDGEMTREPAADLETKRKRLEELRAKKAAMEREREE